ncbi:MAG: translation initiation factor IF-2 N-terminal domain-containing protein, partial [Oleiharenicola lentus]
MSIRIHALAKKLNMDNEALMALLKERGYPAKSVSSTVDNITAEALETEIAAKNPAPAPAPAPVAETEATVVTQSVVEPG